MSQLPNIRISIEYWCIEYLIFILCERSFSTRLTSVTFADNKACLLYTSDAADE